VFRPGEKEILKKLGYEKEIHCVENKICPLCLKKVDTSNYNEYYKNEYKITGACKDCTDYMKNRIKYCIDNDICFLCRNLITPSMFLCHEQIIAYQSYGLCVSCQNRLNDSFENAKKD
jgi:hypothetical protein